jgi:anaerobic dimethyl sulfoxide reductase subunit A
MGPVDRDSSTGNIGPVRFGGYLAKGSIMPVSEEKAVYTTCVCNCGGTSACVIKAHVRDGRVVRVEPDDRYNPGVGMEDKVLNLDDLVHNRLQRRPCTMGLVFHKYLHMEEERVLYPLKRAAGAKRGEGRFERISWDEALDTIADQMKEVRRKHGPYSIITPYMPNESLERLFQFWGAGVDSWGWCSYDPQRLMGHVMAGALGWNYNEYSSSSGGDLLANAKMIVLWGFDPTVHHHGPAHQFAWFIKLARERGAPVILFEPRYTGTAETLADQWIPIKPGTDCAMFLAMAYEVFRNDWVDHKFVDKFVEPEGLERWKRYVMGTDDGIRKTPEWAEKICAVPSETIRDLTRKVAVDCRPAWMWNHYSVNRKSQGEQTFKAFASLQAILGYWGMPGAGPPMNLGPHRAFEPKASWGPTGSYKVPKFYRSHHWARAVLLLDEVRSGRLSEEKYRKIVGWRADPSLVEKFHPKMLFWGGGGKPHASNHLVTATDSANDQIKAMDRMEFIVSMHSRITPTARYADVLLPAMDWMWEERTLTRSKYGGFESVNFCPGVVPPHGQVKPWIWVYTKLAERLGINPRDYFRYYTDDANWDRDHERYLMDCYEPVVKYWAARGKEVPPWERFTEGEFINCDELEEKPHTGAWDSFIFDGQQLKTGSGKIEIFSDYIADETNRGKGEHYDPFGRLIDNLPGDWNDLEPMAKYRPAVRGMEDLLTARYPLNLLTPHSRYRVHYLFWNHPWLRGDVYDHRVWINTADAGARGIKDGDLVKVHNDQGEVRVKAYVTSRIMPGVTVIRQGAWYDPDENGVDLGASPSTLLGGDLESCTTAPKATNLVQIENIMAE